MVNKNKKEMLLGFFALVYAMILLLYMASSMSRGIIDPGSDSWGFFYMFTNQSNFLVLLWLVFYGVGAFIGGRLKRIALNNTIMIAVTVYISITFFIVACVLDPFYKGEFDPVKGLFTHFATPIIMWFYFFAVKGVGSVKYKQAFLMLIYPFVFLILNLIIGYTVHYINGDMAFAYNFINPEKYSNIGIFILVMVVLVGVFGGFGCLLIKFKRFLHKHYYDTEDSVSKNVEDVVL